MKSGGLTIGPINQANNELRSIPPWEVVGEHLLGDNVCKGLASTRPVQSLRYLARSRGALARRAVPNEGLNIPRKKEGEIEHFPTAAFLHYSGMTRPSTSLRPASFLSQCGLLDGVKGQWMKVICYYYPKNPLGTHPPALFVRYMECVREISFGSWICQRLIASTMKP